MRSSCKKEKHNAQREEQLRISLSSSDFLSAVAQTVLLKFTDDKKCTRKTAAIASNSPISDHFFTFSEKMQLLWMLVFVDAVSSMLIGSLENYTYAAPNAVPLRFNGSSCQSCLCDALRLYNASFLALNCYKNEGQCELFFNYSHSYNMKYKENTTFLFYPSLPRMVGPTG